MVLPLFASLLLAAAGPDARCAPKRFAANALKGKTDEERYLDYVKACANARVTELASELIAFPTVSAESPASRGGPFQKMEAHLKRWANKHGLTLKTYG